MANDRKSGGPLLGPFGVSDANELWNALLRSYLALGMMTWNASDTEMPIEDIRRRRFKSLLALLGSEEDYANRMAATTTRELLRAQLHTLPDFLEGVASLDDLKRRVREIEQYIASIDPSGATTLEELWECFSGCKP